MVFLKAIGGKIDFLANLNAGSTAYFSVFILNLIFALFIDIKIVK